MGRPEVWRNPDGDHFRIWTGGKDSARYTLQPVIQDPDTRAWHDQKSDEEGEQLVEVDGDLFRDTFTPVPYEPLRDPRTTRLGELVGELLADYERVAGEPSAVAEEIRVTLAEVAAIPEETKRRRQSEVRQAHRSGFHRGRQVGGGRG